MAGTASSAVFSQVCAVVNTRVAGPSDRSVRVLLLTDLHYLAGALDPKVFDAQAANAADIFERSFRAISRYFLRSPQVFSSVQLGELTDDQHMQLLKEEFTTYAALSGTFVKGAYLAQAWISGGRRVADGLEVGPVGVVVAVWGLHTRAVGDWKGAGGHGPLLLCRRTFFFPAKVDPFPHPEPIDAREGRQAHVCSQQPQPHGRH